MSACPDCYGEGCDVDAEQIQTGAHSSSWVGSISKCKRCDGSGEAKTMTIQEQADAILTCHAAHDDDDLLLRLAQDRAVLLKALKSLDDLTRYSTTHYVEIPRRDWSDLMAEAGAAIEQAERP